MKFAIYKFELVRADQQELFKDGECVGENPQEYLDKLLDAARLNLYRTKKNGETAVYPNDILFSMIYANVTTSFCNKLTQLVGLPFT